MRQALHCALPGHAPQAAPDPDEDGYVLILGANHRRAQGLRLAWNLLSTRYDVRAATRALPTRDIAGSGPRYLNAAVRIAAASAPAPEALHTQLHAIEQAAGRRRGSGLCALDLDLFARTRGLRLVEVYKPADLERDYVRALLQVLDLE